MTIIDICNIALGRLGADRINSLTDNTVESEKCSLFYPISRDTVMSAFNWGFSRKRKKLGLIEKEYTGWTYTYQLPADFLTVREIISAVPNHSVYHDQNLERYVSSATPRYEIASNEIGNRAILLTNVPEAEITYTARIEDSNTYSSEFVSALGWLLASELAMPLRGKPELQIQFMEIYKTVASAGQQTNANQDNNKRPDSNTYLSVRK